MESVDLYLGKRVQESQLSATLLGNYLLNGEEESLVVIWSDSQLHNNLLGINKLIVIW